MVKTLLSPRFVTTFLAACLFCTVAGLKWATFDRFGSAMPDWDQWDAEALHLLAPWYENDHFLQHLFQPHNEHRVVLTKLQNLTLTLLNGQWDARLEAVTNALLHSALATALWLFGRRRLPAFSHAPLWLLAVALFGLPLAWQNILGGFHSQQYWLLALSFAAIVTLPFSRPWSASWWAASAATALALFTMGSGLLAAAVVLGVAGLRVLRRETSLREAWPTLALCGVVVAAGALTRIEVDYHAHMKVKTAHDFFFSLLHSLQWPVPSGYDWLAAVLWLPWVLAAWRVLRDREPANARTGQVIVALGGWVLVQLLATAYARGAGADFPASRYMDTLTFGAMVNGLSLAWLLSLSRAGRRIALATLAGAWVLTLAFGLRDLLGTNLNQEMPHAKNYYLKAEAHMRGYLATNDRAQLAFPDVPYPSADGLADRLSRQSIRALMPAVIRAPLPTKVAAYGPFLENNASELSINQAPRIGTSPLAPPFASALTWGSFDPQLGVGATGVWRSAPLTSPLGAYLKFETAGTLGESPSTISLELRDAANDALLATVEPSKVPGDGWRAAYVAAPNRPFVIVGRDVDPARWLAFSAPVEMGRLSYLAWRTTQRGLLLAEIAAALALGLGVVIYRNRPRPATSKPAPASPKLVKPKPAGVPRPTSAPARAADLGARYRVILIAGLFFAIWGAKLIAIDRYGSDLPYWDQWAKEGDLLLTPWFERQELWKDLFLAHNEHRIAPTLALNLALVVHGGQWDARVQCVASAALHAAVAAGLFWWALRRLTVRWALAAGMVLIASTAPPIAWENVLGGFQSQFYFLAGFSLLAMGGLLTAPALSLRWWGGLVCGLLALVSMGSGLLAAGPLVALGTLRLGSRDTPRREVFLTLGAGLALGLIGLVLRTPAPWHDSIHAHGLGQFIVYGARCLSWPLPEHPWLALLFWLPWVVLAGSRIKHFRSPASATTLAADFLLAGGLWVLLQVAAVTYSRAGSGGLPASRYGDIAALGLMISFLSLVLLATLSKSPRRWLWPTAAVGHLALIGICVTLATKAAIAGPLPAKKAESLRFERSVQAFILTDDYGAFAKSPLPFPLPDWLARILRRPDIRAVLPASVRAPLKVEGFSATPTPPAPPLWERRTHSQVTPGKWESGPLPASNFGWWKFETTGPAFLDPASGGAPLNLASGATLTPIRASRPPAPAEWRAAYVPVPTGKPATLVAQTGRDDQWLAFTEPVEVSSLSHRTRQLASLGGWVFYAGLAGFLAAAGWTLVSGAFPHRGKAAA